ncbi:MAG: 2-amino-4-hydroxy-6-hydroxymethyldihydropteridine diphosphokinase [Rothia mucilaginosa]|uniref:2-amino-4-hydroxy-6- hydroxymethyldihydropteridine diphosphokinase n=1 Tax=Rothia mucilaginosa TaxID=43675 RepID=UPI001D1B74B8|nr:2-amino-4-hydroxy-6-hydroxymethyldihydropteridine diphosphokinase [Rothia mucilaginosa]MBS6433147.1 2-amino-4-hydroxy-6-hydroxymethyldihydropteridine diphosphokinase [Rothia mucilaginosa]
MPLRPLSDHRAVLALGSNLGESESTIERAVVDLREAGMRILRVSPLYRTAPVGGPAGQPDYVNAVIEVSTSLRPYELLKLCNAVEAAHHRERLVRWGPRTLDIDVIDYEGVVSDDPVLTLPHPRAHERSFVLTPWARMDPEAHLLVARSDESSGAVNHVPVSVAELSRDLNLTHEDAGEDAIRYMREMNLPGAL